MKEDASGRRQRAVMATDAEWERIGRAAAESGMDCCSARGLRAERRDKLLKCLDTAEPVNDFETPAVSIY